MSLVYTENSQDLDTAITIAKNVKEELVIVNESK